MIEVIETNLWFLLRTDVGAYWLHEPLLLAITLAATVTLTHTDVLKKVEQV